jgi:tRNA (guanine-N7-)-methyltransferase
MRKKRVRFEDFARLPNCIAEPLNQDWGSYFAQAEQPLWLELAAGKAYFSVELARLRPERNVLALDTKRERLYMGAQRALDSGLRNLAFVWTDIYILDRILPPQSVAGIWITFPDPFPKERHAPRRLTSPYFLALYRQVARPGAHLHFKTDDAPLFDYSLQTLADAGYRLQASTRDLYQSHPLDELTGIPTPFEERWRAEGKPIHYLCTQIPR